MQNFHEAKEACPEEEPFSLLLHLWLIRNSRGDSGEEQGHLGGLPRATSGSGAQKGTGGRSGATTTLKGYPLGPLERSKELKRLQELTSRQI